MPTVIKTSVSIKQDLYLGPVLAQEASLISISVYLYNIFHKIKKSHKHVTGDFSTYQLILQKNTRVATKYKEIYYIFSF